LSNNLLNISRLKIILCRWS